MTKEKIDVLKQTKELSIDIYTQGFNDAIWCIEDAIENGYSIKRAIEISKESLKEGTNKN